MVFRAEAMENKAQKESSTKQQLLSGIGAYCVDDEEARISIQTGAGAKKEGSGECT